MFHNWQKSEAYIVGFVFAGVLAWVMWPLIVHMFEIVWSR